MSAIRPPVLPIDPDTDPRDGWAFRATCATRRPCARIARSTTHCSAPNRRARTLSRHGAGTIRSRRSNTCGSSARSSSLVLALRWLGSVLTPFLVGAILAYLGTPAVDRAREARRAAVARDAVRHPVHRAAPRSAVPGADPARAKRGLLDHAARARPLRAVQRSRRAVPRRTSSASPSRSTSIRSARSSRTTRRKRATCRRACCRA